MTKENWRRQKSDNQKLSYWPDKISRAIQAKACKIPSSKQGFFLFLHDLQQKIRQLV